MRPSMNMRKFFQFVKSTSVFAMLLGFVCIHADAKESREPRKPNIVFILADDLGYGNVGAYGQKKILTPNIDKLAAEGMKFTQFYSGSHVCAPSRSTLMTGQHTGHTAVRANGGDRSLAAS